MANFGLQSAPRSARHTTPDCTAKFPRDILTIHNEQQKSEKMGNTEEATTTSTPDESKEATDDTFDMQPYEDLGLLSNTTDNAEKIKCPNDNVNYKLEGVAHQIAWAMVQSSHAKNRRGKFTSAINDAWEFLCSQSLDANIVVAQNFQPGDILVATNTLALAKEPIVFIMALN